MKRAVAGLTAIVLGLAGLSAGCSTRGPGEVTTAAVPLVLEPTPEQADQTLASFRRLDDHPLYEMTYVGPSPKLPGAGRPSANAIQVRESRPPGRDGYACTVFLAAGGTPLLGRNFDWDPNPALLLRSKPTDGYASLSVVDMSYLGFDKAHLGDLDDPAKRRMLLRAAALPFDGLNEHGLAIGMAADEVARAEVRSGRRGIGSVGIMRLVLDTTRTVDEAIDLFRRHNVDFSGGPPLHYLIADASGAAAVVEFVGGAMKVSAKPAPTWHLMTNFQLAITDEQGRQADWRYRTGSARLASTGGRLDESGAMALLKDVKQGHTQWSMVYDLRAGSAVISTGQRYERVHRPAPIRATP